MEFPEPVIHVAVEPKTKADQDKLGKALGSLSEEDPTFSVRTDDETGQTIIGGMGELHLEVLVDRMMREFAVVANVGKPQVAYRETITQTGREGRGALHPPDRWSGPVRPRGHQPRADRPRRRLRVRRQDQRRRDPPRVHPRGRRRHPGGARRRRARRLRRSSTCGPSSPTARTTTSTPSEMAFKIAGSMAVKKAARLAKPALLEPIMGSRSSRPRTTWATSSATSTPGGARSRAWSSGGRPTWSMPKCRWPKCSAMLATSARARKARDVHDAVRLLPPGAGVDRAGDHRRGSAASESHVHPVRLHGRARSVGKRPASNERRRNRWRRRSSSGTSRT